MAVSGADIEFVAELFAGLSPITTRKMMGGLSIYSDGRIFAMLDADARLYVKATGALAKRLDAAGANLFTYTRKDGKQGHINYWTLPDAALDNPEQAVGWAKAALEAAY